MDCTFLASFTTICILGGKDEIVKEKSDESNILIIEAYLIRFYFHLLKNQPVLWLTVAVVFVYKQNLLKLTSQLKVNSMLLFLWLILS